MRLLRSALETVMLVAGSVLELELERASVRALAPLARGLVLLVRTAAATLRSVASLARVLPHHRRTR